jgi:hypothetical protein
MLLGEQPVQAVHAQQPESAAVYFQSQHACILQQLQAC